MRVRPVTIPRSGVSALVVALLAGLLSGSVPGVATPEPDGRALPVDGGGPRAGGWSGAGADGAPPAPGSPPGAGVPDTDVPAIQGSPRIPTSVLAAYQQVALLLAREDPGCHLTWPVLAGIGQVESGQARAGSALRPGGATSPPILGPRLDGSPGVAAIADTDGGRYDGDTAFDRAVGPMQFIPSSWRAYGADGNGDRVADPHNLYDAALAAGHYLCAGGRDLRDTAQLRQALYGYNHSWGYVALVMAWIRGYASGAVPEIPPGGDVLAGSRGGPPRGSAGPDPAAESPDPAGATRSGSPAAPPPEPPPADRAGEDPPDPPPAAAAAQAPAAASDEDPPPRTTSPAPEPSSPAPGPQASGPAPSSPAPPPTSRPQTSPPSPPSPRPSPTGTTPPSAPTPDPPPTCVLLPNGKPKPVPPAAGQRRDPDDPPLVAVQDRTGEWVCLPPCPPAEISERAPQEWVWHLATPAKKAEACALLLPEPKGRAEGR